MRYKLTDETRDINGVVHYRIEATKDIPERGIKVGDKGGWINSERCKQGYPRITGTSWVYPDAVLSGDAVIRVNVTVRSDARVGGNARLDGDVVVCGYAEVYGNAMVADHAIVRGTAKVFGDAYVSGTTVVMGNARVYGKAHLLGGHRIFDDAIIGGTATLGERTGGAIRGKAHITESNHLLIVNNIGSEGVSAVMYRTDTGGHRLDIGCWEDGTVGSLMRETRRRKNKYWTVLTYAEKRATMNEYKGYKRLAKARLKLWKLEKKNAS